MVCLNRKVNPVLDSTLNFIGIQLFRTALPLLVTSALVLGLLPLSTAETVIDAISIAHKPLESTLSIKSSSPLDAPKSIERTARGWTLRFAGTSVSERAVDVASMTSKLAFKVERRASDCFVTIVSTFDSLSSKRASPTEILFSLTSKKATVVRQPTASAAPVKKGPWSLDVIVIDPGHGGQDAGAEGVNGAYEKNVVLAIGRKLRDILTKTLPNTKVVMTRETDVFIELFRRTEIANQAGGKLFVSIHCNSMPTKPHPAHGCETYILRPGRNDDAARVARRENASVNFETAKRRYEGMTEDQIIVATMAQRSFVKLSESFAVKIQREITSGSPLADRGVSQAGFFVLVGASMPNVLVETGFLSNTGDAEYLASSKGQAAIAQGLARSIQAYAREYQQSLQH